MHPKEFVQSLERIAQEARHHPQPAVMVAELAQLLSLLAKELLPVAEKYSLALMAAGFPAAELVAEVKQVQVTADSNNAGFGGAPVASNLTDLDVVERQEQGASIAGLSVTEIPAPDATIAAQSATDPA